MSSSNHIKRVAIVGAGGNSGKYMVQELLKTGKHTVTALTRADSKTKLPEGVQVKRIDYENPASLVEALKGQDALVITMNTMAPADQHSKLVQAAADAGVPWVLPNEWAPDTANEALVMDVFSFAKLAKQREEIGRLHGISYVAVATGFWYEWSLAIASSYGFDFAKRQVTFFDDGMARISTSTFAQVGRAVAALLSLPIQPEGGDEQRCLERFGNQLVHVDSFTISQRDMLESALRVTGTSADDWKVVKEPVQERYAKAVEAMKQGDRMGFVRMMYSRVFYPDGCGDFEGRGTLNDLLGLPKEDLDEATKAAIERSKGNIWN